MNWLSCAGSGSKGGAIESALWLPKLLTRALGAAGVAAAMQTWDLIDPDNSIKRDVVMQGPAASSSVKTGNAFAR
jgi:hypothetical protein